MYLHICVYMCSQCQLQNVYVINNMQVFDREGYDKPTIISQTFMLYICKNAKLQLKIEEDHTTIFS